MSSTLNPRKSLACLLICSLSVTGLLTITTPLSHASNNSLPHSLTPTLNEHAKETGPQTNIVNEAARSRVSETPGKLPLSFEENRGQVDKEVKYISRGSGYTLFLTPTEAVLALRKADEVKRNGTPSRDLLNPHSAIRSPADEAEWSDPYARRHRRE